MSTTGPASKATTSRPRTSIIIRNFNRSHCLERAVDSALAQTDLDFEIVFVDDASTDGSAALVQERYGHLGARLSLVAVAENVGAGEAANLGIAAARGEFIAFLDSDDAWLPEFLQYNINALVATPTAAISFCNYIEIWEPYNFERLMISRLPVDQREAMLLGGFIHSMSLTVMRSEALTLVPKLEAAYSVSHDFSLWMNLALELEQPCVHVEKPLVRHYRSADGVTTDHVQWLQEYREALSAGYSHPNAEEYRANQARGFHNIALGVVARRKTGEWLERTCGAMISVILRTQNQLNALQAAIQSIRAQTYQPVEIIVIDDASTDGTAEWLGDGDGELWQHIRVTTSCGPGGALNLGLAAATGELVAFMDDHARWSPAYLETQLRANSYVTGAPAFTVTDYQVTSDLHGDLRTCEGGIGLPQTGDLHQQTLACPPDIISNLVCRREQLLRAGGGNDVLTACTALDVVLKLLGPDHTGDIRTTYERHPPVRVPEPLVTVCEDRTVADNTWQQDYLANFAAVLDGHIRDRAQHLRLLQAQIYEQMRTRMGDASCPQFGL